MDQHVDAVVLVFCRYLHYLLHRGCRATAKEFTGFFFLFSSTETFQLDKDVTFSGGCKPRRDWAELVNLPIRPANNDLFQISHLCVTFHLANRSLRCFSGSPCKYTSLLIPCTRQACWENRLLIKGCFLLFFFFILASRVDRCSHLSRTLRWHWSQSMDPLLAKQPSPPRAPEAQRLRQPCEKLRRGGSPADLFNYTSLSNNPQVPQLIEFISRLTLSRRNYALSLLQTDPGSQSLAAEMWVVSVLCSFP